MIPAGWFTFLQVSGVLFIPLTTKDYLGRKGFVWKWSLEPEPYFLFFDGMGCAASIAFSKFVILVLLLCYLKLSLLLLLLARSQTIAAINAEAKTFFYQGDEGTQPARLIFRVSECWMLSIPSSASARRRPAFSRVSFEVLWYFSILPKLFIVVQPIKSPVLFLKSFPNHFLSGTCYLAMGLLCFLPYISSRFLLPVPGSGSDLVPVPPIISLEISL